MLPPEVIGGKKLRCVGYLSMSCWSRIAQRIPHNPGCCYCSGFLCTPHSLEAERRGLELSWKRERSPCQKVLSRLPGKKVSLTQL